MGTIDDRKRKILQAIIDDYIDTAEPVGSRTIVKKCDLGLSPATIRNEMADLEDMGFLKQPHTSAGRVPSLVGYRYYVDELMTQYSLTLEEINTLRSTLEMKMDYLEKVIAKTSQVLSKLTNYTTVISAPTLTAGSLKQIRLVGIDLHRCLTIVITNQGVVRDRKMQFSVPVTEEKLSLMEKMLNKAYANVPFGNITVDSLYTISEKTGLEMELLFPIIDFMRACVKDSEETEVYMDGATNILNFPEYSDLNKVKRFLNAVNDRKDVMRTVNAIQSTGDGINIRIGSDNAEDGFSDCSIITSRYKIGDSMEGVIGIIGPVRMDYKKAVSVIKNATDMLNQKMLELPDSNMGKTGEEV